MFIGIRMRTAIHEGKYSLMKYRYAITTVVSFVIIARDVMLYPRSPNVACPNSQYDFTLEFNMISFVVFMVLITVSSFNPDLMMIPSRSDFH